MWLKAKPFIYLLYIIYKWNVTPDRDDIGHDRVNHLGIILEPNILKKIPMYTKYQ